ncbi:MAG: copper-translocating P-type ATPase [Gemmatimonadetes bacterium]|nr:copper-translocating P-type ATPase [Gemmatimonadota bacterium]
MFRRRFWLALALTAPTIIWGEMMPRVLGFTPPIVPGARWIPVVFGTAVFVVGGWIFVQGAWREVRDRRPGMMTLISLAITVAFVFSLAVTVGFPGMPLWWELASLVTIMLFGHWMEMRSVSQAQGALRELAKLLPDVATRLVDGTPVEVPRSALQEGDLVLLRPGASVPADGVVRDGRTTMNESMITGESRLIEKRIDDSVIAGTVNGDGSLRIQVTRTGERTALAGIMRLVAEAQQSRSRAQVLADRAAFALTLVAIGAALITGVTWTVLGAAPSFVIERVVTVLVIACPHALGLAVPLVVAISTTIGARSGLLVRDRRGLEEARTIGTVVFDKTGTLTLGEHRVVAIRTVDGGADDAMLQLAAAVEQDAEHSVARAIVASAAARGLMLPRTQEFAAMPGFGAHALIDGQRYAVGGPSLLTKFAIEVPSSLIPFSEDATARGEATVYLIEQQRILAAFVVADAVRPEAAEAVRALQARGIEVVMLTGDARRVAEAVAKAVGIQTVFAQVLPAEKTDLIRSLQAKGQRVAMVGDGVNDAPALLTADVGVAIGAGTSVAVEAGDIVLVGNDPRAVARIIALSAATYRKMVQNLWWAAGYNIVAIPLAAGVLDRWGLVLSPAVGAVLMSVSTIIVAINAQLLRRAPL